MIYVLVHGNCFDGFGAAFCAWKKFGDGATYIACSHGQPLPADIPEGSEVYMIDFSAKRDVMIEWNEKYKFTVIDHHKTAEEALRGLDFAHFDMTKSGALLAWEYFHPGVEVPELIAHVSDRDLWQFKLEGTAEVHASLLSYPFDFKVWDSLSVPLLKAEGRALLRMSNQIVDKICNESMLLEIDEHVVAIVNTSSHWSEVGNALLNKYPMANYSMSFTVAKDSVRFSLRSRPDFDVSKIAQKHGGGGHKQAAGYQTKSFSFSYKENANEAQGNVGNHSGDAGKSKDSADEQQAKS